MEGSVLACAVCGAGADGFDGLAQHFVAEADESDVAHVMWLNRHVTKFEVDRASLAEMLRRHAEGGPSDGELVAR